MQLEHRAAQHVGAEHVDRQALGIDEQVTLARRDAAREVARAVQYARSPGSQQRIAHLARDALETSREHGEFRAAQSVRLPEAVRAHGWITRLPEAVRSKRDAVSRTTVVKGDSTMAGPVRLAPGSRVDQGITAVFVTERHALLQGFIGVAAPVAGEIEYRKGDFHPHPRARRAFCDLLGIVVHVGKGGYAPGQHLHHGQFGAGTHEFRRKVGCFQRPDDLVQPLL